MTIVGADVSAYQPGSVFDSIVNSIDFGLAKATEGTDYVSATCDQQYQSLKTANKLRGTYHFADVGDAQAQAEYYVKNIQGYIGDGVLVLDYEGQAATQGDLWAKTFLDELKLLTGVVGGLYASESLAAALPQTGDAGYWLYNANYGADSQTGFSPLPSNYGVGTFKFQTIRQFSSVGRLAGYGSNLDLDAGFIDAAGWAKLAAKGGSVPLPAPLPAPKPPTKAPIAEDGYRGPATILCWQEVEGTTQDGTISNPSPLIKADQQMLNRLVAASHIHDLTGANALVVDGVEGSNTIKVRQFLLFNEYAQAVFHRKAALSDFDGVLGVNTNKLHQHALNKATVGSKKY